MSVICNIEFLMKSCMENWNMTQQNSTWVKGILVIVESVVRNLINGGVGSNPINKKLNLGLRAFW